jgi:hypothetical protein
MTGPDRSADRDDCGAQSPDQTVQDATDPTATQTLTFSQRAEAAAAVEAIFGADGPPDFDDITGPLHWPKVPAADAGEAWEELRHWVEHLLERFSHLDHHAIPSCWWRHNGHVEALAALRDHERMCYSETSPPTAAVEWHRAFRDVESRLREWTSTLSCGATHDPRPRPTRPTDANEWCAFLAADSQRRAETQPQPDADHDSEAERAETSTSDGERAE